MKKPSKKPNPSTALKAPFPYAGGKRTIAAAVWEHLGTGPCARYIEPFAGSLAVLLARPGGITGQEIVNDGSCYVANAWRAIAMYPAEVAALCVAPTSEVDIEAQHYYMVKNEMSIRDRMGDPEYCDIRMAAWWITGACRWIGSGWCSGEGPWAWDRDRGWYLIDDAVVNRQSPHLGDEGRGPDGVGISGGLGKTQAKSQSTEGQYQSRIAAITAWMTALRDRICHVRITCGAWERCVTPVIWGHPTPDRPLLVYLDPPYEGTEYVYAGEGGKRRRHADDTMTGVSRRVRDWCIEHGKNQAIRIVISGRAAEHDELLAHGWRKRPVHTRRGYAKVTEDGDHGGKAEVLWISPACAALDHPEIIP